ncbi:hypothetical protein CAOG_06469 [Capsaspora owczarzaki ATCC 30864]|uniref:SAP domain-containing protein n=1 Tax=Capsaspora owczarzaki (strain ATCC 30864) TaxID=595528 RepID=A0A0D2WU61_CAPO3|nr:hypothetical protein CAOG_06469 [Capsaspora owczarzaki ATCC 30864]KJE96100.1 hypothetical protein CAOG_006469 [Capsaspora owczarzaki ATCC 30864]|eukprot:XP_004345218.2 hypothetical protein CAOG_06469 [Capsaspora owczarzaki ATCC 30864]
MLDLASLKVADLRRELQDRGLPTTGLKKDLLDRLTEHLAQHPEEAGAAASKTESESTESESTESATETQGTNDDHAKSITHQEAEEQPNVQSKSSSSAAAEEAPAPVLMNQDDDAAVVQAPISADPVQPAAAPAPVSLKRAREEDDDDAEGGVKSSSSGRTLHIANFSRPLTLNQVNELLARTGKVVPDTFWMDSIKSQCYATFETVEEANATFEALNGINWPAHNMKKLVVQRVADDARKTIALTPPVQGAAPLRAPAEPVAPKTTAEAIANLPKNIASRLGQASDAPVQPTAPAKQTGSTLSKLDSLFRKTTAAPPIYWLPVSDEKVAEIRAKREQQVA